MEISIFDASLIASCFIAGVVFVLVIIKILLSIIYTQQGRHEDNDDY